MDLVGEGTRGDGLVMMDWYGAMVKNPKDFLTMSSLTSLPLASSSN